MRKFLITALAAGSIAATGAFLAPALAAPSTSCSTATPTGGVTATPSPSGGKVAVCTNGTGTGVKGSVTASGSATDQSGYVVADGDKTNSGPLKGYIGISSAAGDDASNPVGIVACSGQHADPNGTDTTGGGHPDYNPAGGNNSFDPSNPDPSTGPCAASPS